MALKARITKEEHEALSDALKSEYKAQGDAFVLDVDDSDFAAEMRRARDREKQRADEAQRLADERAERLRELEGNDARKRGDIDAIEKSWKEKLDKETRERDEANTKLRERLERQMIDSAVNSVASEIFIKPSRDARLIRDRIYVDHNGDEPVLRIRDKDGKPSALTLADLKKETLDNDEYADILVGSKATGSGGAGGNKGGGAAKQPSEYTEQERTELYRRDPAEFRRLFPLAS